MVKLHEVSYTVTGKTLLHPTTVDFAPDRFHVIMGANGAGKSTLLKLMSGYLTPSSGHMALDRKELMHYTKQELAVKRAVLSQHYHIAFPISVAEVVLMGRYPYFTNKPSAIDRDICAHAVQLMQLADLKDREYTTLSGGEAQKVQMSRVLAQIWPTAEGTKKILFLDEPVSSLDVKYQYQLMQVAKDLCKKGITVIAVLHDLNLALSFADRLLLMKKGHILYDLAHPAELTAGMIQDIFDIPARIESVGQKPIVIF